MSQKKVDAYKREKANREKTLKKEKRMAFLEKAAGILVCLAIVAWIGYSVYGKVTQEQETQTTETVMDASAIDDYTNSLTETASDGQETETEGADAETAQ